MYAKGVSNGNATDNGNGSCHGSAAGYGSGEPSLILKLIFSGGAYVNVRAQRTP